MSANANLASTPRLEVALVATANANYDGTGAVVALFTAGASGARLDRIEVIAAQAAIAAAVVRIFSYNGSTYRLVREILITAVTGSATAIGAIAKEVFPEGMHVPASGFNQLVASISVSQPMNVVAYGGDY